MCDRDAGSMTPLREAEAMIGQTIPHHRVLDKLGVGFLPEVSCVVGLHRKYPNQALAGGLGRTA